VLVAVQIKRKAARAVVVAVDIVALDWKIPVQR
jgi:hypothetical protein